MKRKSGRADEERDHRAYRETYGRGGGESFEARDYPQSYGGSGGMDWRRALRAYVGGHDRGWETERKEREAAGTATDEPASPTAREAGGGTSPGAAGRETGDGSDAATAPTVGGSRFGVPVPDRDRLRFHRGASVWRDRLPAARRLPRHTDRRLDTSPGRGGQA